MISPEYRKHLTDDELASLDMRDCDGLARVIVRMRKAPLSETIERLLQRHSAAEACELMASCYSTAAQDGRDLDVTHELGFDDQERIRACQRNVEALDSIKDQLSWTTLSELPDASELQRKRRVA